VSIDPNKLKFFSFLLFTKLEGAVTSGMVHLGDQLGLYRALAAAAHPLTTSQLAAATGLQERWVREWAYNQASAKLISVTSQTSQPPRLDDDTFFLSPEQTAVLADESHPAFGMGMFHRLPQTMESLKRMPESFRTGMGFNYDSHGPDGAIGIERSFEPWNNANLVPVVLPAVGIVDTLRAGANVADVGASACGDEGDSRIASQRWRVAVGGHQGTRHVRNECGEESDGIVDVRHQRVVVHVIGAFLPGRCRTRNARPLGDDRRIHGAHRGFHQVRAA